jgi:hypothetical protein
MSTEELIRETVLGFPDKVLPMFQTQYSNELDEFVSLMAVAYDKWTEFDSLVSGDEELSHVSGLIYGAINFHAIAMHLLISGFLIASGNTQRQVLECIAMALLASKRNLGYLHRYANDKFSTNKAIDLVIKKHKILNLNDTALKTIKTSRNFYNKFSHPTMMTVASHISLEKPGEMYFGASFDAGKMEGYKKEINGRVGLAKIIPNFINGVRNNLKI